MPKNKFIFFLPIISALFFASLLSSRVAVAQCSWMDGLSVVHMFNSVHDNGWMSTWEPSYSSAPAACALHASSANDPDPVGRPSVKSAIRSDTCPSAHDIDCDCHAQGCPPYDFGAAFPGTGQGGGCSGPY
jgi:hypothetical protein